jgi:hypothetical protein
LGEGLSGEEENQSDTRHWPQITCWHDASVCGQVTDRCVAEY